MIALVFKGDQEELKLFPKILKSGFLDQEKKEKPYLMLKSEFSSPPGQGSTLTSNIGCCSISEKILKLE